jgi:creatinine amidohydrolase
VRVHDLNWMQLEDYLERDDRIVLPLGSTEQHAYLSLGTDSILAERVSVEAAAPLGVPVLPALAYGLTPSFGAFPGSPTLRVDTFLAVVGDLLDSLADQGFRRILVVNGHGGNAPVAALAKEWMADNPDAQALFHNWWSGASTWAAVEAVDPAASHASWSENFPWTRLDGVELPSEPKPMLELARLGTADPATARELLGDGSYGGAYAKSDEEMDRVWQAGVEEVRALLEDGWRRI